MKSFYVVFIFSLFGEFINNVDSREFNNPILINNTQPSVLIVNNAYYMVTNDGTSLNRIPIYVSIDLEHWSFVNYVFTVDNFPTWAAPISINNNISYPEMHFINGKYNVYFRARNSDGHFTIGVATAPTPTGPFRDAGDLYNGSHPTQPVEFYPNIARDGKYFWPNNNNNNHLTRVIGDVEN